VSVPDTGVLELLLEGPFDEGGARKASPVVPRNVFERELGALLDCNRHATASLLHVAVDRLKPLMDRLGADAAYAVMETVARELIGELPHHLIARGGSESFLILLRETTLAQAKRDAHALCRAVRACGLCWKNEPLHTSLSIGVVELTEDALNAPDALCAADTAAAEALDAGGNRVCAYRWNDSIVIRTTREFNELPRLQRALETDRFVLDFQPIQGLGRTSLPAGELLIRMIGEDGAIRPPSSFLPVAERYALTPAVDRFAVRTAIAWLTANPTIAQSLNYLSVNLSGQTLGDGEVRGWLESQVQANAACASRLCFEITETAFIRNLVPVRGFLERMAALGCRFALDDFGTGFSSLGYLQSLPVDFVKIDGAFVRGCDQDPRARTMLGAINDLCHTLGKQTVAEYVERPEILSLLREIGIDHAQGYAVSMPFRLDELPRRLACEAW
jgi:ammonium transporter, Amt family